MTGTALAQTSQPQAPVLPPPLYAAPTQTPPPTVQPQGPTGPFVAPGMGGLYNTLTYGQRPPQCTPSPLVPTACR